MSQTASSSTPFQPLNIAVLTVSDSRTDADDKSGNLLVKKLQESVKWYRVGSLMKTCMR
jgi:molybdopterin biosynthesis enzyme MoaB